MVNARGQQSILSHALVSLIIMGEDKCTDLAASTCCRQPYCYVACLYRSEMAMQFHLVSPGWNRLL